MTINLPFTSGDWHRIERDWAAWWAHELGRPLAMIETYHPVDSHTALNNHQFVTNFPPGTPDDLILDHFQSQLEHKLFLGDAWPNWWPNFGPGIAAGFLGAELKLDPDTVWYNPPKDASIQSLQIDWDRQNRWWQRVHKLTSAAIARWGDQVSVGFTDIGGNLDILASLIGTQDLALALYDHPAAVERLSREITGLWLRCYEELFQLIHPVGRGTTPWAHIWSPQRTYMLQSDFAYMISPAMFERFVLPDLEHCCAELDHAFYHLDGPGQIPHLDLLLSLDRLRGIQWVPGAGQPPPEKWLPLLKRIRDAGKLCQLYISAQGALTITRELGGAGFAFAIEDPLPVHEAIDFLAVLQRAQ